MNIRRVVTGVEPSGKSVFIADDQVTPKTVSLMPGTEFHQTWGADERVTLPSDGTQPAWKGYFPPAEGFRFGYFTLGPESVTLPEDLDFDAALAELAERLPGLADVAEPENPGMHTTDTVDFDVVLSGEVWLELDDGAQVQLKPGDCVIQNGTRHAWHNKTDQPCTLAVAIVGARRSQ